MIATRRNHHRTITNDVSRICSTYLCSWIGTLVHMSSTLTAAVSEYTLFLMTFHKNDVCGSPNIWSTVASSLDRKGRGVAASLHACVWR